MSWIQTYTGKKFWPLSPRAEDIDDKDIAHALSLICRFNGHSSRFYSVAEHSIRVAHLVDSWGASPRVQLAALLHDASEAYIADVSRPLKRHPDMIPYRNAEALLQAVIEEAYGISDMTLGERVLIKKADSVLLVTEARYLMAPPPDQWTETALPLVLDKEDILGGDSPDVVQSRFLALLDVYAEELAIGEGS